MKIEFFTLKAIQTTYRNKDSFLVKKCCNFIPFEMVDHGNASRIKIIFYIICHICRWVQSPFHDIGCFCQEWHLKKKKNTYCEKNIVHVYVNACLYFIKYYKMHWNNREGSVVAIDGDRSSNLTDDWLFFLTYEMECYMLLHFVSDRSKIYITLVCHFIFSITYP